MNWKMILTVSAVSAGLTCLAQTDRGSTTQVIAQAALDSSEPVGRYQIIPATVTIVAADGRTREDRILIKLDTASGVTYQFFGAVLPDVGFQVGWKAIETDELILYRKYATQQ